MCLKVIKCQKAWTRVSEVGERVPEAGEGVSELGGCHSISLEGVSSAKPQ